MNGRVAVVENSGSGRMPREWFCAPTEGNDDLDVTRVYKQYNVLELMRFIHWKCVYDYAMLTHKEKHYLS